MRVAQQVQGGRDASPPVLIGHRHWTSLGSDLGHNCLLCDKGAVVLQQSMSRVRQHSGCVALSLCIGACDEGCSSSTPRPMPLLRAGL